jgi:midasin (ATPase involved in ribosome maturation)
VSRLIPSESTPQLNSGKDFLDLFRETSGQRKNAKFEESVQKAWKWKMAVSLWRESGRLAKNRQQVKHVELSQSVQQAHLRSFLADTM